MSDMRLLCVCVLFPFESFEGVEGEDAMHEHGNTVEEQQLQSHTP